MTQVKLGKKRWLRLWDECLDSPKIQQLSGDSFKSWVNLLCLASRQNPRGSLPDLKSIAFSIRLTTRKAKKLLDDLIACGLVDCVEGKLSMHDWDEWQPEYDLSTDRVRAWREERGREKPTGNVSETLPKRSASVSETPVKQNETHASACATDSETESELRKDVRPYPERSPDAGTHADAHAREATGRPETFREAFDRRKAEMKREKPPRPEDDRTMRNEANAKRNGTH